MSSYGKLKTIFKRFLHLKYIQRIMNWDEAVMMPAGGGADRANALATLSRVTHQTLASKKIKPLIEQAKHESSLSQWDSANLRLMEKLSLRETCISSKLAEKLTQSTLTCEQAWRTLRAKNNWSDFYPSLEKNIQLVKEIAARRGDAMHLDPYDALLDEFAPGFNQRSIDTIFSELKNSIPALVQQVIKKQNKDVILPLQGHFSEDKQKMLGLKVMEALQFDFQHGRLDISHHPFCSGGPSDIRITTRYRNDEFLSSLMGICHETGHALYEQGLPKRWRDQPVGLAGLSMAMHESQSLLIERQVCGSMSFFQFMTPLAQSILGHQDAMEAANLFKMNARVQPSLIRVDADEVTYPLHVVLRYEIEKGLFKGDLSVQDLPACWDEYMTRYLGISTKDNYKDGVMQDVHWPSGAFGYFPAYTLGRLIAAQFFATFMKSHPHFDDNIKIGDFQLLKNWLTEHIYSQGSLLPTHDLLVKVTGEGLNAAHFIEHVKYHYKI